MYRYGVICLTHSPSTNIRPASPIAHHHRMALHQQGELGVFGGAPPIARGALRVSNRECVGVVGERVGSGVGFGSEVEARVRVGAGAGQWWLGYSADPLACRR